MYYMYHTYSNIGAITITLAPQNESDFWNHF